MTVIGTDLSRALITVSPAFYTEDTLMLEYMSNHLEGVVAAVALIVSIIGAALGRYFANKDMLRERRADVNKELYYNFFELVFSFIDLTSPEFVDGIIDSVLDEYQCVSEEGIKSRIDRAYIEISRRRLKTKLQIARIETYSFPDMPQMDIVMEQVNKVTTSFFSLLDSYSSELKKAFIDVYEPQVDGDFLRDQANQYESFFYDSVGLIKENMRKMKTELVRQ